MKRILFLAVLMMATAQAWSANVDAAMAQASAQRFFNRQVIAGRMMAPAQGSLKLAHTEMNTSMTSTPVYYIFNASNAFVIVSGEDRAREILAYGDQALDLNDMPVAMKYWLSCYKRQLEYLQANPDITVDNSSPKRAGQQVLPLITANWNQNAPYWNECPTFGSDTCYTGCAATSLAMVFNYWHYPQHMTPAVPSYTLPQYGVVMPELPPTVFDWNNMLDEYTGDFNDRQAAAVAHLMRYIGQAEEMDYTISGSGALSTDILKAVLHFNYDQNAKLMSKNDELGLENYNDTQWGNMIQAELEAGRPIVYCAYDNYTGSGHAFDVDGYDEEGKYHVNWGWAGRGNGFFALNAFSYNEYTFGTAQQMVIGIQPAEEYNHSRLQAYPASLDMECYINRTDTATFTLKGTNLNGAVTLTVNDPAGDFSINTTSLTQASAEAGEDITVTYAPKVVGTTTATITCTSEGCEPLTITLNGHAPLEVYAPEMLPANENRVNLTSFRADWTDATPAGNVASYTLEVNPKPAFTLLEEADFSDLPQMAPSNQAAQASQYLPEGWTFNGSEFNLEGGCVSIRRNGTITTDVLNLKGYDKMTVEITAKAYGYYGSGSELNVTTSQGTQELVFMYAYETQTIVVDCAETEQVIFKAGYYPMIKDIKIYAGDATQGSSPDGVDADYRLIEGITGVKYCDVQNLTAGGTFLYRVKTVYIDGTHSEWSNVEAVTLKEGSHNYQPGDVNHDRAVDINDVTDLIAHVLGQEVSLCSTCADLNDDDKIDINDVTTLIGIILNGQ